MVGKILRTILVLFLGIILGIGATVGGVILVLNTLKIGTVTEAVLEPEQEAELVSEELKELSIIGAVKALTEKKTIGAVEEFIPAVGNFLDSILNNEELKKFITIDHDKLSAVSIDDLGSITEAITVTATLETLLSVANAELPPLVYKILDYKYYYDVSSDQFIVFEGETSPTGEYFKLDEATGEYISSGEITIEELCSINSDMIKDLTLSDFNINFTEDPLVSLVPSGTKIGDLEATVNENINSISLTAVLKEKTGNHVLDVLREDETVNIGNIGEKLNALSIAELANVSFMKEAQGITGSTYTHMHPIYTYDEENDCYNIVITADFQLEGDASYHYYDLDPSKTYYEVNGGIWFLILANVEDTTPDSDPHDYDSGAYDRIWASGRTVEQMENIANDNTLNLTDKKLKLLNDLGLTSGINRKLYDWTIGELIALGNAAAE